MKLYFSPGACSIACRIVALAGGYSLEYERVNLRNKVTAAGGDFKLVNPKGYVPALALDDGAVLTEVSAILQYLADHAATKTTPPLLAPVGALARYRTLEWLSYVGTELHKSFTPLFSKETDDATKERIRAQLGERFAWLSTQLEGKAHLEGEGFTIADAYLFTILRWTQFVGLDRAQWPVLQAWYERAAGWPFVAAALEAEGAKP